MKSVMILVVLMSAYFVAPAQGSKLDDFNRQQVKMVRQSMTVLGSWSAANLLYSGISLSSATGSNKYFHQMNMMWGGINISLAAIGYFGAKNRDAAGYMASLKKQSTIENVFLMNAGLDLAYIAGGFYLKEKGRRNISNPQRATGFGNSIVLQGSALLLFDAVMYFVHQKHGRQLYKMGSQIQIAATSNGIGCIVHL